MLVSQAIAALPEGGSWIPVARWRKAFRATSRGRRAVARAAPPVVADVETALKQRQLVELRGGKVNAAAAITSSPRGAIERRAMGLEFCALFIKALLDKLALAEVDTGTHLRNHYRYVDPEELPEIQRAPRRGGGQDRRRVRARSGPQRKFLNMLITSTPF